MHERNTKLRLFEKRGFMFRPWHSLIQLNGLETMIVGLVFIFINTIANAGQNKTLKKIPDTSPVS